MFFYCAQGTHTRARPMFARYGFRGIICGTPLGFVVFVHINPVYAVRHWPAFLTNFLLRSEISALVRISLDLRLCRVSTQLHPHLCPKPTPALDFRSLATNFVRNAGWALEWNCFAVHSSVASFNPGYGNLSS